MSEATFSCANCTYSTNTKAKLRSHLVIHSEPQYPCTQCDYKGKRKADLMQHLKKNHADTPGSVSRGESSGSSTEPLRTPSPCTSEDLPSINPPGLRISGVFSASGSETSETPVLTPGHTPTPEKSSSVSSRRPSTPESMMSSASQKDTDASNPIPPPNVPPTQGLQIPHTPVGNNYLEIKREATVFSIKNEVGTEKLGNCDYASYPVKTEPGIKPSIPGALNKIIQDFNATGPPDLSPQSNNSPSSTERLSGAATPTTTSAPALGGQGMSPNMCTTLKDIESIVNSSIQNVVNENRQNALQTSGLIEGGNTNSSSAPLNGSGSTPSVPPGSNNDSSNSKPSVDNDDDDDEIIIMDSFVSDTRKKQMRQIAPKPMGLTQGSPRQRVPAPNMMMQRTPEKGPMANGMRQMSPGLGGPSPRMRSPGQMGQRMPSPGMKRPGSDMMGGPRPKQTVLFNSNPRIQGPRSPYNNRMMGPRPGRPMGPGAAPMHQGGAGRPFEYKEMPREVLTMSGKGQIKSHGQGTIPHGGADNSWMCDHCKIMFFDQAIYLMHKGMHSPYDPWQCNLCATRYSDVYSFTSHFINSHNKK
ncbi:unnamed protein product [Owenia fusiformis]|uniref:C2H2-type domain-containing protein n=1 Tax=Owenia fusiformis TaxID=6347 RepID=A0A8S4P262_OWEFU|nr:unnamed protein product [Owenia fusiformis]